METKNDNYWLATNSHASARYGPLPMMKAHTKDLKLSLNLQHFWNQLSCGYLIHPDIALSGSARIADIGTGTGIWPISLSATLPSTVQFDGFDVTDAQFPPSEWLPSNVRLETWNVLEPVPEHLVGQYDVVNIRYFALVVRKENLSNLLKNLISLLKPNGYLQWIEINIAEQEIIPVRPDISMAATSSFSEDGKKAIASLGVSFDWLKSLPSTFEEFGLAEASQFKPDPIPALRPMSSHLAIGGWEEFSYNVLDKKGPHPLLGSGQNLRQRLYEVRNEIQTGGAIEQFHYVTIGKRPA